jgi:hypothetical protein
VFGLLVALIFFLVIGSATGDWGWAAAGSLIALFGSLIPYFSFHLWSTWRHPDQHKFWSLNTEHVYQAHGRPHLYLAIKPRYLMVGGYRCLCSVRSPDRLTYHSRVGMTAVEYPRDFEGAPPLVAGVYRVCWLEPAKKGKLRPLLEYRREVTEAMIEPGVVTTVGTPPPRIYARTRARGG